MEYILAGIWKGQMSNSRMLKSVPGSEITFFSDYFKKFLFCGESLSHNVLSNMLLYVSSMTVLPTPQKVFYVPLYKNC